MFLSFPIGCWSHTWINGVTYSVGLEFCFSRKPTWADKQLFKILMYFTQLHGIKPCNSAMICTREMWCMGDRRKKKKANQYFTTKKERGLTADKQQHWPDMVPLTGKIMLEHCNFFCVFTIYVMFRTHWIQVFCSLYYTLVLVQLNSQGCIPSRASKWLFIICVCTSRVSGVVLCLYSQDLCYNPVIVLSGIAGTENSLCG